MCTIEAKMHELRMDVSSDLSSLKPGLVAKRDYRALGKDCLQIASCAPLSLTLVVYLFPSSRRSLDYFFLFSSFSVLASLGSVNSVKFLFLLDRPEIKHDHEPP